MKNSAGDNLDGFLPRTLFPFKVFARSFLRLGSPLHRRRKPQDLRLAKATRAAELTHSCFNFYTLKNFHRIKRIFELPASVALTHGARMIARKFSRIGKVRLEKELIPNWPNTKPQFPLALFRAHMTGSKEDADRIVNHEFDLLGSGLTKLGKHIDWQKDFSGRDEIKVPWELSRFQFLSTLIKTFETLHDETYAQTAKNLIHDWILKNPIEKGVNWQSPLEVAIRACNFALALYFLHDEREKTFLTSMVEHGKFLLRNLEYGPGFNTNHLIGNFTGLFFLGVLFPQFKEARKWKAKALIGLEEQMEEQVGSDGVLYEASTAYHSFVTELFGHCALLARENEIAFSQDFLFKLEKMFSFIHLYTKPNGLTPIVGDSDDGKLFLLDADIFWIERELFQKEGSAVTSRGYHDAHFYIMRKNDWYLFIHGGGIGQKGNGGHDHNDALSFELTADGEDFIVDPGTYCYTFDPEARNHFRSTRMHNTVIIDGKEQNKFRKDTVFGMIEGARPQLNRWESTENFDLFDGQHGGLRRTIHFDKKKLIVTLADFFEGKGRHELEWNFHFAPDVMVSLSNRDSVIAEKNGKKMEIRLPPELAPFAEIREDFVSPSYGVKEKAKVLTLRHAISLNHPIKPFMFSFR